VVLLEELELTADHVREAAAEDHSISS